MRPLSAAIIPVIMLNRVVFPAPFGPITLTIWPSSTWSSRSSMARTPPKSFTSPLIWRSGMRSAPLHRSGLGLAPLGLPGPKPRVLEDLFFPKLLGPPSAGDEALGPLQHHEDQEHSVDEETERRELLEDVGQGNQYQRRETVKPAAPNPHPPPHNKPTPPQVSHNPAPTPPLHHPVPQPTRHPPLP